MQSLFWYHVKCVILRYTTPQLESLSIYLVLCQFNKLVADWAPVASLLLMRLSVMVPITTDSNHGPLKFSPPTIPYRIRSQWIETWVCTTLTRRATTAEVCGPANWLRRAFFQSAISNKNEMRAECTHNCRERNRWACPVRIEMLQRIHIFWCPTCATIQINYYHIDTGIMLSHFN